MPRFTAMPHHLSLLAWALLVAGCASTASTPPSPPAPTRSIGTQTQALIASAAGTYDLRFALEGGEPDLLKGAHELSVSEDGDELRIHLESGGTTLVGIAEELDDHRWIAGLAGTLPGSEEPLVMHITAVHAGDGVAGSVVVDAALRTHSVSFIARRKRADGTAFTPSSSAVATQTQYHLPGTSEAKP
jgi:hypothetical protein